MRVKLGLNKRHDRDEGERAEPGANARAGQARRARARANVRRRELGGRKQKTVDALLHDRTRDTSGFYTGSTRIILDIGENFARLRCFSTNSYLKSTFLLDT